MIDKTLLYGASCGGVFDDVLLVTLLLTKMETFFVSRDAICLHHDAYACARGSGHDARDGVDGLYVFQPMMTRCHFLIDDVYDY